MRGSAHTFICISTSDKLFPTNNSDMNTQNTEHERMMLFCLLPQIIDTQYQVLEEEASELYSNIQDFHSDLDNFETALAIMEKWKQSLEKKREDICESMKVQFLKQASLKELQAETEKLQDSDQKARKRPRTDQAIVSILPEYL